MARKSKLVTIEVKRDSASGKIYCDLGVNFEFSAPDRIAAFNKVASAMLTLAVRWGMTDSLKALGQKFADYQPEK